VSDFKHLRIAGRGFDSHRPLQILKDLRSRAGFHGFQNINFVAKLHGKFSADLFERNFASVKCRHCSRGMTLCLAKTSAATKNEAFLGRAGLNVIIAATEHADFGAQETMCSCSTHMYIYKDALDVGPN
jgi:hypothetical protein